jgi:hypothetical protein
MDGGNADMGLYNLNNDPHELTNRAVNPDSVATAKIAELEACYQQWIQRTSQ